MTEMPECLKDKPKDLVWVEKSVAEQYKQKTSIDEMNRIIIDAANDIRKDMVTTVETLDDDIVTFKAKCIAYKKAYGEAVDSSLMEVEQLFFKADALKNNMNKYSGTVTKVMADLNNMLGGIRKTIADIDSSLLYKIEHVNTVMEKFRNMSDGEKEIIKQLVIGTGK